MKSRMQPGIRLGARIRTRTILFYTTSSLVLLAIVAWSMFVYFNMGRPGCAMAGSSYSSTATGNWSTNSTWSGGTAPSLNLNGDNVTINTGNTVTVSGNLSAQNNCVFTINGTLQINGDFTVQNNLTIVVTGKLIITGKVTIHNGASLDITSSGTITIGGNVSVGNNADFQVDGKLGIGGSLSFGTGTTFDGSGTVTVAGTGCTGWSGSGSCNENIPLPIKLISFLAKDNEGKVLLSWKTASELNNDFFTLERSGDGKTFERIATIKGAGTTNHSTSYEYVDASSLNGISYYRLSQTDFDGSTEIFKPVSVELNEKQESGMHIFPNPITGNTLNISFDTPQQGTILIIDADGNKILTQAMDGTLTSVQLQLNDNIRPGLYYVNCKTATGLETVKIIKQR